MDLAAELFPVTETVINAFDVRDPIIRALIAELGSERHRQRAEVLAKRLGLRNRFHLAHLLSKRKLPSLVSLRAVLRVVTLVHQWETQRASLARQALRNGQDPAAWCKTVRRVTGHRWREIRETGANAVAAELARRFRGGSLT